MMIMIAFQLTGNRQRARYSIKYRQTPSRVYWNYCVMNQYVLHCIQFDKNWFLTSITGVTALCHLEYGISQILPYEHSRAPTYCSRLSWCHHLCGQKSCPYFEQWLALYQSLLYITWFSNNTSCFSIANCLCYFNNHYIILYTTLVILCKFTYGVTCIVSVQIV